MESIEKNVFYKEEKEQEIRQTALKAFFELLSEKQLSQITLEKIAQNLSISEEKLKILFPTKKSFFEELHKVLEHQIESEYEPFENASLKDFLFESLMRRLEFLQPYKAGLSVFLRSFQRLDIQVFINEGEGGLILLQTLPLIYKSMEGMILKWKAPVEEREIQERLQNSVPFILGLCIVYGMASQAWAEDEDPHLSQTLVVVDKYIETLLGQFN